MIKRFASLAGIGLVVLTHCGCASFRTPKTDIAQAAATPEQLAWWEANRDKARYIPGKGYYVEGTSGYFDDQGRPVKSSLGSSGFADEFDEDTGGFKNSADKFSKGFKKMIGQGPNEGIAKAAYADGDSLFRQAKYKQAADKFKVAYKRWPDSPQEEDAMFKAAEAYFFADYYVSANDTYGLLVKKYPNSQYLDRLVARRFAIARYWEQHHQKYPHYALTPNTLDRTRPMFDTLGHALKIYDRVRLDDPTGPLADDSIMATANCYFSQGRYEDSDYYYSLLRNEYPKSEHQYNAHLLGLRSKLLKYQGPEYSGAPLEEADEVAQQLLTQFAVDLGDEKQRILEVRNEIRAQKAVREFEVAKYYHKNQYYGASRMYFDAVAKAYPDTQLAQQARAKIEEVKDQPASPTPPFEWLAKVIPEAGSGMGNISGANAIPSSMPTTPQGMGSMGGISGMGGGN